MPRLGRFALILLLVSGGPGCATSADPAARDAAAAESLEELRIGYGLLAETLAGLSQLKWLKVFKQVTLRGPVEEVGQLMDRLASASKQHAAELRELRGLPPDVSGEAAMQSPIGNAITAAATNFGKAELFDRSGGFDLRFVILKTQATRMVAAIAVAISGFEPHPGRKKWLAELSREYEGHRRDILAVLETYIDGEGAAQQRR